MADKVIPQHMIPDVQSNVLDVDGKRYLESNEAMFTFYKRSKGEFSKYFLGLKEEKKIYGMKCPKCGLVRVPPFELYCPDCEFTELREVEMAQEGVMNSTPPITYFGHSLMQHQVPFGRGRVMLDGADTALPIHVYTSKGVLTPRVFKRGTRVKVIFRKDRIGNPRDIFAVPIEEVPEKLRGAKGVEEHQLDWESPVEPSVPAPTPEARKAHDSVVQELIAMSAQAAGSDRVRKDLAGWKRDIQVKSPGGAIWDISESAPSSARATRSCSAQDGHRSACNRASCAFCPTRSLIRVPSTNFANCWQSIACSAHPGDSCGRLSAPLRWRLARKRKVLTAPVDTPRTWATCRTSMPWR